jgi:hypothetical protein
MSTQTGDNSGSQQPMEESRLDDDGTMNPKWAWRIAYNSLNLKIHFCWFYAAKISIWKRTSLTTRHFTHSHCLLPNAEVTARALAASIHSCKNSSRSFSSSQLTSIDACKRAMLSASSMRVVGPAAR